MRRLRRRDAAVAAPATRLDLARAGRAAQRCPTAYSFSIRGLSLGVRLSADGFAEGREE
jgi:hypothetical protein